MKYLSLIILILCTISISAQNNVGIGITNPSRTLEIGGIESQYTRITSTNAFATGIEFVRTGPDSDWRWQNNDGFFDLYRVTNDFTSVGFNDILASFTDAGRLGVGTPSPQTELDVVGTIQSTGLRIGTTVQNGRVHIKNSNQAFGGSATTIRVESTHNGSETNYGMYATGENSGSGDSYGLRAQGNVTGTGDSYGVRALAYANGTGGIAYGLYSGVSDAHGWALYAIGKNYMSGDLRIGTLVDPYNGAYKVIVDGKIISEEVRIQNSTAWPDYVFKENYDLMPLDELAQEIKDNGHLPNIPPASEVENEGFLVGDMQVRMMEKIEELTLYILQLEKRIAKIEKR